MAYIEKTHHKDGSIESEVFVNNGIKEGEYKEYHENGQLCEICNYINGKKEGEYIIMKMDNCGKYVIILMVK
jgi:antitoxin component YwqK of YwqJK toxin-antitoxin module